MTELPSPDDLALALFVALRHGGPAALIVGDTLGAHWWDGELLQGATIDGEFDLRRAAEWLLSYLRNPNGAVVIPPGAHTLYETVVDGSGAFLIEQLWRSGIKASIAAPGDE